MVGNLSSFYTERDQMSNAMRLLSSSTSGRKCRLKISMFFLMKRADLTNACNLKNLKRADAERAVEKAKERLAKVFGIKVVLIIILSHDQ